MTSITYIGLIDAGSIGIMVTACSFEVPPFQKNQGFAKGPTTPRLVLLRFQGC